MAIQQLLTVVTILTLISCDNKSTGDNKPTIKSFELSPTNGKDTINVVDSKGRKQGIWLTPLKNPNDNMVVVSDTIIYRNDTVVSTSKK